MDKAAYMLMLSVVSYTADPCYVLTAVSSGCVESALMSYAAS